MIRRPVWLGAGIALGVGGTLWAEQRVRRGVRRAVEAVSPSVAASEAVRAAKEAGGRVRDALDAAREERRRREVELWRQMGELPPRDARGGTPPRVSSTREQRGGPRQHR